MPRGTKKRARGEPSYGSYIHRVMKKVHPDLSGSRAGIEITNAMVDYLVKTLAQNSVKVAGVAKKSTLSARHVQSACRMCFPGELANHAISEGSMALAKFTSK